MNQFRLRGTWEDDPAPLPFPGTARAGRNAGADTSDSESAPAADTDSVIADVEAHLDRVTYKIDELRDLLTPFDRDPPPAA